MKIAILGGTGDEGMALGFRWALAGNEIIIGSRQEEKGALAAAELRKKVPDASISGTDNMKAAAAGDIAVLSVPYEGQEALLKSVKDALTGKVLITVIAPTRPPKVSHVWRPPGGSAAQEAQQICGEEIRVVAAFQNIATSHLQHPDKSIASDVLICGGSKADKQLVASLAGQMGIRGIDAGPLVNASVVEGLVPVLIGINIRHKVKDAGFRITGIKSHD